MPVSFCEFEECGTGKKFVLNLLQVSMIWPTDKEDEVAVNLRGRGKKRAIKVHSSYAALLEMLRARKLVD